LVLSDGKAVEYGSPYELLSDEKSQFAVLVSQTGGRERARLIQLAKMAAMDRQS
jgi:hypothetical protein